MMVVCDAATRRQSMIAGMTTKKKIAVSLPSELVDQAGRAVAEGRAASVSAYVARALEACIRHDALDAAIADYEAEFGAFTAEELEATAVAGIVRSEAKPPSAKAGIRPKRNRSKAAS